MAGVRNGVLVRSKSLAEGWLTLGRVPPQFTWLIKNLQVYGEVTASTTVAVHLFDPTHTLTAKIAEWDVLPGEFKSWDSWSAMNSSDTIEVYCSAAGVHIWLSGAELPGAIGQVSF